MKPSLRGNNINEKSEDKENERERAGLTLGSRHLNVQFNQENNNTES